MRNYYKFYAQRTDTGLASHVLFQRTIFLKHSSEVAVFCGIEQEVRQLHNVLVIIRSLPSGRGEEKSARARCQEQANPSHGSNSYVVYQDQ